MEVGIIIGVGKDAVRADAALQGRGADGLIVGGAGDAIDSRVDEGERHGVGIHASEVDLAPNVAHVLVDPRGAAGQTFANFALELLAAIHQLANFLGQFCGTAVQQGT